MLARLREAVHVERVVGLWALGALLQTYVGQQVAQPSVPMGVRRVVRQWTTTGRLSPWARGQFARTDRSGALRPWRTATLTCGTTQLRHAGRVPVHQPPSPVAA